MTSTEEQLIAKGLPVAKTAAMLNHLRQNRIEYLVLLVFSHMLGLTDLLATKATGVCGL